MEKIFPKYVSFISDIVKVNLPGNSIQILLKFDAKYLFRVENIRGLSSVCAG